MDPGELHLFASSLRQLVADQDGEDLDRALADLGWLDALAEEPSSAVPALFEAIGAAAVSTSALHHVLATGLGTADPVVLPALGSAEPSASGLWLGPLPAVVHVPGAGGIDVTDLTVRPVTGIDPSAQVSELSGWTTTAYDARDEAWTEAMRLGRLALAQQLIGCGRTMLTLACSHALDRVQFGVPISSFQAVRHRLADTLVLLEAADGLTTAAWEDGEPQTATMAKALAGRAGRTASRHAQQVLAGIGFTTEHRFHLYARRVLLLDQLLGSSRALTEDLGRALLAQRHLPPLQPL
jgi:hypothetical protein